MPQPTQRRPDPSGGRPAPTRRSGPPASGPSTPSRRRPQQVRLARPWWQRPWAWGGAATAVVIVVVVVFVLLAVSSPAPSGGSGSGNQPVPASVLSAVTGVSQDVSSTVGTGGISNPLQRISGSPSPLTGPGGEPQLFYYGAEWCPYCAAERWSLVVALSRFGTFSNLHLTMSDSNPSDIPNTHTFTFHGSTYSSQYLSFAPVESEDRNGNTLQTPTAAQQQLVSTYDTAPYSSSTGGIPFQDLGNRFVVTGSGVNPELLQGMDWQQIASTLSDTQSQVAQQIIGNANWLTAGICTLTDNRPGSVCGATPIPSLESQLSS